MCGYVTLMRFHGKALDQHQIRTAESVWADIIVSHENVTALGRYSDVATVRPGDGNRDHPRCTTAASPIWEPTALCYRACNSRGRSRSPKRGGADRLSGEGARPSPIRFKGESRCKQICWKTRYRPASRRYPTLRSSMPLSVTSPSASSKPKQLGSFGIPAL